MPTFPQPVDSPAAVRANLDVTTNRPEEPPVAGGPVTYTTQIAYTDRQTKAGYIADKYRSILRGSVLDVGCDRAPLRELVGDPRRYTGIDIEPTADIAMNLDEPGARLPLADRSIETVVCTDVLEHLERCHEVFDELCRVAKGRVIVSLPNPLRALILSLFEGKQGKLRFYGLPVDPPQDRHRWFFGFEDARRFVTERGRRMGFSVEQLDTEGVGAYYWKNRAGVDVLHSLDVHCGTMWCVLVRDGETAGAS